MAFYAKILVIFILMGVGYAAAKAKVIEQAHIRGFSQLVLNVSLPITVIASFDRSIPLSSLPQLLVVAASGFAIHGLSVLVAAFAYRGFPDGDRKVLSFVTVFSNCAFVGIPVAESVFGKTGVMYASIYGIAFQVFTWTYGVTLFSGAKGPDQLRKALINPGNIAVLLGILVWVLPFELPRPVKESLGYLSALTTPLSMIVVGASLAGVSLRGALRGKELWLGSALRLLGIPLLVYALLRLVGLSGEPVRVAAFLSAMPAAAQTVIFAERYEADVSLASRTVFVSTVLSAFTIPLFVLLLG